MATKLDNAVIRETSMLSDGKPVVIALTPSGDGGELTFRLKGKGGKPVSLGLRRILEFAQGGVPEPVAPPPLPPPKQTRRLPKSIERIAVTHDDVDAVQLSELEARIMVSCDPRLTHDMRGAIFGIVREMHEERHEEAGLPPVQRGTVKAQKLYAERDRDRHE